MRPPIDVTNERYGMLVGIKQTSVNPTKWLFKCDCGNKKEIILNSVRTGHTTSCGCKWKKFRSLSKLAEHHIWLRIQKQPISKSWTTFENFQQDMGVKPAYKFLCRKNILKPFSKTNCYWGDKRQYVRKYIWHVKGKSFASAVEAGQYFNVTDQTIINWCKGYIANGWFYPALSDCYVEKNEKT